MATIEEEDEGPQPRLEQLAVTVRTTLGLTQRVTVRMWLALIVLAAISATNPITPLAVIAVMAAVVLALDIGRLK